LLLTAVKGFPVYSFELQLDCFDVVHKMLQGNGEQVQDKANLYHIGISNKMETITAGEGCDPSYSIAKNATAKQQGRHSDWERRTHRVGLLTLDNFLDQRRGNRTIALLKLDIEGAELRALHGLDRHLENVQNIIMEFAIHFTRRFSKNPKQEALDEFGRLKANGFRAHLLFSPKVEKEHWWDKAYLKTLGLERVYKYIRLREKKSVPTDPPCCGRLWIGLHSLIKLAVGVVICFLVGGRKKNGMNKRCEGVRSMRN
jgi:FkbM family methyltransferase